MKIIGTFGLVLAVMFTSIALAEVPIEGYWKSIDDETNEATAYWKIEIENDQLLGYIVNYPNAKVDDVCVACKGDLSSFFEKPVKGTPWLNLSKLKGNEWQDGYIIDSGKGEKYKAKVWLEDNKLMMRGYVGFFYRTQIWQRAEQAEAEQGLF
ncbi:MAG: hypothetical protein ACI92E_002346 [Oceanicoccus sp.]|jgi:uncharacterized protein (DUF2147 family)